MQGHSSRFCVPWEERGWLGNRILGSWTGERPSETTLPSFSGRMGNLYALCQHIGIQVCKVFCQGTHNATHPASGKCCALELRLSWNFCCYVYLGSLFYPLDLLESTWNLTPPPPKGPSDGAHFKMVLFDFNFSSTFSCSSCDGVFSCLQLSRGPVSHPSFLTAVSQAQCSHISFDPDRAKHSKIINLSWTSCFFFI